MGKTLSGATTQNGPRSDGSEGVLCLPQSSSFTGTSPSDCLMSYPGQLLRGESYPIQRCSRCILQPQPTRQDEGFGLIHIHDKEKLALSFFFVFCFVAFFMHTLLNLICLNYENKTQNITNTLYDINVVCFSPLYLHYSSSRVHC